MFSHQVRYMVQQLNNANVPPEKIHDLTGVSERSIRRIVQEPEVTRVEEPPSDHRKGAGRPSEVAQYAEIIREWLSEARDPADGPMKSREVLARLRQQGYKGGKTAVYELVKQLRPAKAVVPIVRFEGLPGEFSQHDFGQRRVQYADGRIEVVKFFASRLKYSRYVDVQVVANEQQETVVRCLLNAFETFGGVPLMGVFDNMSSAVKSRDVLADGTVKVHWTDRFAQVCIDCGLIPLACWPYRPQQKGSVENLVGFVKGNFFCGRQFKDRNDLIEQMQAWVTYVNTERTCDATGEIPQVRLLKESLKPCAHKAETYAFKVSVVVRPTARAHYRGMEYSVPADTIGQTVTLHLQQTQVSLYLAERHLGDHPRTPANGKSSVLAEHAQQLFIFKRGKPFAQRQILLDLDPLVEPYLTELVHRRPQTWQPDVEALYDLYQHIGRADFLAAIALATEERCFGSEYVQAIVQATPEGLTPPPLPILLT